MVLLPQTLSAAWGNHGHDGGHAAGDADSSINRRDSGAGAGGGGGSEYRGLAHRCLHALTTSPWVEMVGVILGMVTVWYLRRNDDGRKRRRRAQGATGQRVALSERIARGLPMLIATGVWQLLIQYGGPSSRLDPLIAIFSWIILEMLMTYVPPAAWDALDFGLREERRLVVAMDSVRATRDARRQARERGWICMAWGGSGRTTPGATIAGSGGIDANDEQPSAAAGTSSRGWFFGRSGKISSGSRREQGVPVSEEGGGGGNEEEEEAAAAGGPGTGTGTGAKGSVWPWSAARRDKRGSARIAGRSAAALERRRRRRGAGAGGGRGGGTTGGFSPAASFDDDMIMFPTEKVSQGEGGENGGGGGESKSSTHATRVASSANSTGSKKGEQVEFFGESRPYVTRTPRQSPEGTTDGAGTVVGTRARAGVVAKSPSDRTHEQRVSMRLSARGTQQIPAAAMTAAAAVATSAAKAKAKVKVEVGAEAKEQEQRRPTRTLQARQRIAVVGKTSPEGTTPPLSPTTAASPSRPKHPLHHRLPDSTVSASSVEVATTRDLTKHAATATATVSETATATTPPPPPTSSRLAIKRPRSSFGTTRVRAGGITPTTPKHRAAASTSSAVGGACSRPPPPPPPPSPTSASTSAAITINNTAVVTTTTTGTPIVAVPLPASPSLPLSTRALSGITTPLSAVKSTVGRGGGGSKVATPSTGGSAGTSASGRHSSLRRRRRASAAAGSQQRLESLRAAANDASAWEAVVAGGISLFKRPRGVSSMGKRSCPSPALKKGKASALRPALGKASSERRIFPSPGRGGARGGADADAAAGNDVEGWIVGGLLRTRVKQGFLHSGRISPPLVPVGAVVTDVAAEEVGEVEDEVENACGAGGVEVGVRADGLRIGAPLFSSHGDGERERGGGGWVAEWEEEEEEEEEEGTPVPAEFRPAGREGDVLWEWKLNHLRKDEDVGMFAQGTFGKVVAARTLAGRQLAVKIVEKSELSPDRYIERELELLEECSVHPNVVGLLGVIKTPDTVYVLMPLADTDLAAMIKSSKRLDEKQASFCVRQVVAAVGFLHSRGIVHRDVKPANLLVLSNKVLLADFGLAKKLSDRQDAITGACGTKPYLAPELVRDVPYDKAVDLWAIGVVTFELLHGYTPFSPPLDRAQSWDGLVQEPRQQRLRQRQAQQQAHQQDAKNSKPYGNSTVTASVSVSESSGSIVGGRMFERSAPAGPGGALDRAWVVGRAHHYAMQMKGSDGPGKGLGGVGGRLGAGAGMGAGRRGGYREAVQLRLLDSIARGRYRIRHDLVGTVGREFISELLHQSPARRMSTTRAGEHPWLGSPSRVPPRRRAARAEVAEVTAIRAASTADRYAALAVAQHDHRRHTPASTDRAGDAQNPHAATPHTPQHAVPMKTPGLGEGTPRRAVASASAGTARDFGIEVVDAAAATAATTLSEIANLAAVMAAEAGAAREDAKRWEKVAAEAEKSVGDAGDGYKNAHGAAAAAADAASAVKSAVEKAEMAVRRAEAMAVEVEAGGAAAADAFRAWEREVQAVREKANAR